jgi:hypothetical protein
LEAAGFATGRADGGAIWAATSATPQTVSQIAANDLSRKAPPLPVFFNVLEGPGAWEQDGRE